MKLSRVLVMGAVFLSSLAMAELSNEELARRINLLNEEIQQLKTQRMGTLPDVDQLNYGLARAASKVYSVSKGISIGGYGEITYTNYRGSDESGSSVDQNPETEVLRAILYVGYKFDDNWIFNSEIEIEHADQIFMEFAYIDRLINEYVNLRAGLILMPIGFLNLYHEPTTFLSVSRPDIEQSIIPSTWRENGLGAYGRFGKLSYQAYIVNGLDGDSFSSSGIRGGRKKGGAGGRTDADTYAFTLRLDYDIAPNTVVGGSFYAGESTSATDRDDIGTTLFELHAQARYKGWYFRALYAQAQLSNLNLVNTTLGNNIAEQLKGYYVELGYNLFNKRLEESLTPFVRYESYNTQESVSQNVTVDPSKERTNITIGLAYQPLDQVIFKIDYTIRENEAETGVDEFNAGIGYMF